MRQKTISIAKCHDSEHKITVYAGTQQKKKKLMTIINLSHKVYV